MFKKIPGTKDILPDETPQWQNIEEASRNIFNIYNYKEIRPPLIEEAGLFNRSLGQASEIVQKQMFLIEKAEDVYALRPEATASIVRAYIENNFDKTTGFAKFYYIGPMFRLERPQKGRLRQFHHLGCEAIGSQNTFIDVEIIALANNLLKAFLIDGYKVKVNSLGCQKDKAQLSEILHSGLKNKLNRLCADCQTRFKRNILRILDCKNEDCIQQLKELDIRQDYLCPGCKTHFNQVKAGLDSLKIEYEITPYLVRGLDYYTRTVFEITHPQLGSQNALGAGGRYDNLVADLGGADTGAIGFAFGIERLLLARTENRKPITDNLIYLITLGEQAKIKGLKLLSDLRRAGIKSDTDYEDKSIKGAMRKANDLGAKYVLLIGEDELIKGAVTLKDMASGEQREIKFEKLLEELKC